MKRVPVLTAVPVRHPFRRSLMSVLVEPHPNGKWTDAGFFLASFVSGFIIFFGMIF